MPNNLTMPRLSDTMEVGTIVKWHVKPGQKVKSGEVIADIETDKATMELQTFEDGVIGELAIPEGQSTPVGAVILKWQGGAEAPAAQGQAAAKTQPVPTSTAQSASPDAGERRAAARSSMEEGQSRRGPSTTTAGIPPTAPGSAVPDENGHASANGAQGSPRVFASPLARKVAADTGVNLAAIRGTGPSGRITRRDVEEYVAAAPRMAAESKAPAAGQAPAAAGAGKPAAAPLMIPAGAGLARRTVPLSNMRRTIATRLVESKTTIPHYQVTVAVRMDALLDLRGQLNGQLAGQGVKLSVNDFIVRACALAMHPHPFVNSRWTGQKGQEAIEILEQVNVGVAISLPEERGGGLVVATIRQADAKGLRMISQETKTLADKARTKGLTVEEMGDSTFTISNLGMFGVEHFTAIINPPNAAILAVGAAVKKPLVVEVDGEDEIVVGHEMQMTMSSDHRIVDGAMAAQYLATVKQMLESPAALLV